MRSTESDTDLQILVPPLTNCVILAKLPNLSVLSFPFCKMGMIKAVPTIVELVQFNSFMSVKYIEQSLAHKKCSVRVGYYFILENTSANQMFVFPF